MPLNGKIVMLKGKGHEKETNMGAIIHIFGLVSLFAISYFFY